MYYFNVVHLKKALLQHRLQKNSDNDFISCFQRVCITPLALTTGAQLLIPTGSPGNLETFCGGKFNVAVGDAKSGVVSSE
jgi:hypothetical protein